MKVWVLNLKHREDRYNRITKALDKEGVDYEIFHGLYWKDENFNNILKMQDMEIYQNWKQEDGWNRLQKRKVTYGEAAVAASTILMWEKILKDGDDMVLCLQDDTVWEEGKMKELIDLVERNDYLKHSGLNDDYYSFDRHVLSAAQKSLDSFTDLIHPLDSWDTLG